MAVQQRIQIPNNWAPRDYQLPVWEFMAGGGKRAACVWHRRAGKDMVAMNRTAIAVHKRVGMYWHMLPQAAQARKVIWDGIDKDTGTKFIDQAFPQELRLQTYKQEMKIEFRNGSIWQLCGSDNYDSLIGGNPLGVVFSEYSVAKPSAWEYIRPILAENNGWAMFLYTPRGKNHGHTLYAMAQENPDWFAELLTVNDTNAVPPARIDFERNSGMIEEMIQQEFYCSFHAAVVGSYYGKTISELDAKGQVTSVPHDPATIVHTTWDIGMDDQTAIWFIQVIPGGEVHVIDYIEDAGKDITFYLAALKADHRQAYLYGTHYVPHDFKARHISSGRSCFDIALEHGLNMQIIPRMKPIERVQPVRTLLPRCWFDKTRTEQGLDALRNYRREYDEDNNTFKSTPVHDWASHAADAFGHFAVGYTPEVTIKESYRPLPSFRGVEHGWMVA